MGVIALILYWVVFVYNLLIWARIIIEMLMSLNRNFRPSGFLALIFEVIFTLTDPPLKFVRKLLKPVPIGPVLLDLSPILLLLATSILLRVLASYI